MATKSKAKPKAGGRVTESTKPAARTSPKKPAPRKAPAKKGHPAG